MTPDHHQPRHAGHTARHAPSRARRRPGPMVAWAAVLALAGFALSPEPAAPAAPLAAAASSATARTTTGPPMSVDEAHTVRVVAPLAAAVPPVGARWGTDIGWPQCGHALPAMAVDLTIVQVTAGRPGTVSPCLAEQVAWARSVRSAVNAYVVPGTPSAADLAAVGRSGHCRGDRACLLRAAGAADAAHALAGAAAAGLDVPGWWLDVEDVPERTLWGRDTAANTQVLVGWRDELRRAGKAVGVYSTRGYWRQVVGRWQADLPQWVAVGLAGVDAAARACGRPFTSGPVLLAQWLTGPLDGNLLCRGREQLAGRFFGHFARTRTAGVPDLLVIPVPHPDIEAAERARAALEAKQAKADQQAKAEAAARTARQSQTTAGTQPPAPAPPAPGAPTPEPPAEPTPEPPPSEPASAPSPSPSPTPLPGGE